MRILISAFACCPHRGSEPGLGWGVVREAARRHQVCVLTHPDNQPYIETEIASSPMPSASFVFVALLPGVQRAAAICGLEYLYYFCWQLRAYLVARRLHRRKAFDLVHHVTYCNSWAPSFMGWLGVPFVWCAGGREVMPGPLYGALSWRSRAHEAVRSVVVKSLGMVTDFCTGSRARLILSSSEVRFWRADFPVRRFLLGALDQVDRAALGKLPARTDGPFRMASIGRLEGWKGFGLGVRAFSELVRELPGSEYWIVGAGPERRWLTKLAERLGCAGQVRFLDWMPRASVLRLLSEVDVLVHPSLHENFGYVVLEAMAAGRPVICLGFGGCGQLVAEAGGIVVPVSTPERVVSEMGGSLHQLALDPARRRQLGQKVRKHALEQWNWDKMGERLSDLYHESGRGTRDEAGEPSGWFKPA